MVSSKKPSKWSKSIRNHKNLWEKVQEICEFLPYTDWLASMFIDGSAEMAWFIDGMVTQVGWGKKYKKNIIEKKIYINFAWNCLKVDKNENFGIQWL